MSIDHIERPTRPASVITFYDHDGVIVTDQWLLVHRAQFALAELNLIERARGPITRPTLTALAVGAFGLAVVPLAILLGSLAVGALAGLVAMAGAVAVPYCGWRWPASFQLWSRLDGEPTLLFATNNRREFGRVRRALIRAVEYHYS